ncbi:F-box LRR-repeat [Brachionus plicatilis]|uniref:F-box LRR-repeat n=1 Tax=Brachionus plicatilis TaxID=10195 RepID=A0A3M7Q8B9_BRAPC|nr:F-box LRR-repeat [Brachionus plicatilis]
MNSLPDELTLKILSYLDVRDLIKCSRVCKQWYALTKSQHLWSQFSLTDIQKPKWCPSKLVDLRATNYLITSRFSPLITRVDMSKLCFTFETLDLLFSSCRHIKSLSINFKYLQIKAPYFQVEQCIHKWPRGKLEKLYVKNVCDMKTRRMNSFKFSTLSRTCFSASAPYDIIELEIIKLMQNLFRHNSQSLRILGLKCVDPTIITSCKSHLGQLQILLLNNVNDTDSVLEELSENCPHLKCVEIDKCPDFKGDGFQGLVENCAKLETLQLGKNVHPSLTELMDINWSNLKNLKELSITTKFQFSEENSASSGSNSSSSSNCHLNRPPPNDVYAKTLFCHLSECSLEYLALTDFTLRFPAEASCEVSPRANSKKKIRLDACSAARSQPRLKHLILRNIRNVKQLSVEQTFSMKHFLIQQNCLLSLDLIGVYIDTKFICDILPHLTHLKKFYFGHGKSYKKYVSTKSFLANRLFNVSSYEHAVSSLINIDDINNLLASCCRDLESYGIFYRQSELRFRRDEGAEFRNEALMNLVKSCPRLAEISYLKSFKIQDDDDELMQDEADDDESDDEVVVQERPASRKNYFYYIKYAIENACEHWSHVNMRPCYGFDISPSSGHLLDFNNFNFIETSLPAIQTPVNDFHKNVLKV